MEGQEGILSEFKQEPENMVLPGFEKTSGEDVNLFGLADQVEENKERYI